MISTVRYKISMTAPKPAAAKRTATKASIPRISKPRKPAAKAPGAAQSLGPHRAESASPASLRVVIMGRGQLASRKLYALRIRPDVMQKFDRLVSGPRYLALEWCISEMCRQLEERSPKDWVVVQAD